MITQEVVTAEINYRLERAQAASLAGQVPAGRPSALRRWLAGFTRPAPRTPRPVPASSVSAPVTPSARPDVA